MTEIPMPNDYTPTEGEEDEEEGFCDRCCECWCQLIGIIILIALFLVIMSALFGRGMFGF
ncbi:MAG: hypothetical protein ACOC38_02445 [Promethearchaeia archaeon]